MNNWDKKPKAITVVCGAVPDFAIGEVLKDIYSEQKHWESSSHSIRDAVSYEAVNDSGIPNEELIEIMYCLDDHMGNMDLDNLDSWMSHQSDLRVHEEDNLWVDISYGVYHGPFNTLVHVWYVSI